MTSQLFIAKGEVGSGSTEGGDQVEGGKEDEEEERVRESRKGEEKEVVAVRTLRREKNAAVEGGSARRHSVS